MISFADDIRRLAEQMPCYPHLIRRQDYPVAICDRPAFNRAVRMGKTLPRFRRTGFHVVGSTGGTFLPVRPVDVRYLTEHGESIASRKYVYSPTTEKWHTTK